MLSPGDTFDRYTVLELLGAGGMGRVYRARDERLGRDVALKVLISDGADARERMLREARAAAALDHPNVVSVFDVGDAEAGPHIVMELVSGANLRTRLIGGEAPWALRVRWLTDVARALEAAHARGIIHRDVKPENVMIRPDGVVKVLDFGIARRGGGTVDPSAPTEASLPTLTALGSTVGTPLYMAPEQIRGDAVDGRTDQFAWGVTAYELLSGRLPWRTEGGALGVVASILTDQPAPLGASCPGLPEAVARVVERSLAKRPEDRYPSMSDLLAALDAALEGRPAPQPADGSVASQPGSQQPAAPAVRYSTEQMKAIFERALRVAPSGYERSDLVAAAREIGIDEAALDQAMSELEPPPVPARLRALELRAERRRQARSFARHAAGYVIVNVFWRLMMGGWSKWILLGWGIGLAMHLLNVIVPKDRTEKKSKKSKKDGEREAQAREIAAEAASPAVEEGVRVLLSTTARLRTGRERKRVRVREPVAADDSAGEIEAEAEAEAEAEPSERKRGRRGRKKGR